MRYARSLRALGVLLALSNPLCPGVQVEAQTPPTRALLDSARVLLEAGEAAAAADLLDRVLAVDPQNVSALVGRGRAAITLSRSPDEPVALLERAVRAAPTSSSAHYWLGRAYLRAAVGAIGRGNEKNARDEFEATLQLDPSHPDASYQLGLLFRNVFDDLREAERWFDLQQEAIPSHRQARFEQLRCLVELGSWRRAVEVGERAVSREPSDPGAYPWLAAALWKSGAPDRAMEVFGGYFGVAEDPERELYFDMALVLTPEEQREFGRLDSDGRRAYWANYWRSRDPDPRTEVNERLLEHYIRVAYSRIEFGREVWPWDSRGDFYVRYGEPDMRSGRGLPVAWSLVDDDPVVRKKRQDFQEQMGMSSDYQGYSIFDNDLWTPPPGVPKHLVVEIAEALRNNQDQSGIDGSRMDPDSLWNQASTLADERYQRGAIGGTPERWVYGDRGIDIRFDDPVMSGRYQVEGVRSRQLVDRMELKVPTLSEEEDRIERIDPMDSVTTFRGAGGKTIVEYAYALLPEEFGTFRSVTGRVATLQVDVDLHTPDWKPAAEASWRSRRLRTIPQVKIRGTELFVDAARMEVASGTYLLNALLMDPVSGRRAVVEERLELPDYTGSSLMMSDIQPAALVRPARPGSGPTFVHGDIEVLPLPGRALQVDQPLFIYYEIYNLAKDPIGATSYEVTYSVGEAPEERALASRLYQGLRSLLGRRQQRAVLSASQEVAGIQSEVHTWLEIDVSALGPDTYELDLLVTDRVSGASVTARLLFRALPPVPGR